MLKTGIVWWEETFKIEKSRGCQGSFFVFSIFVFFGWTKTLSYKFFWKIESKESLKGITSLPNLKEFHRRKFEQSDKEFSIFSPQKQLRHQNRNSPRSLRRHARIFEPRSFVNERFGNGGLIKIHTRPFRPNRFLYVFFWMVSPFLLLGCNLSYIVDLCAVLMEQGFFSSLHNGNVFK